MKKILLLLRFGIGIHGLTQAQSTNPAPYCVATFDDQQGFPVDDHINKVSFGTLSNNTNAQYPGGHYVFYNNLPTPNFSKGNSYMLKLNFAVAGGAGYAVWIDYNHNNAFDSIEKVAGTTGADYLNFPTDSVAINVTIPATAQTGTTRMRVRIVEDDNHHGLVGSKELACNLDTSAANTMDWGETEDYTINIQAPAGIDQMEAIADIAVYPNPANNVIYLTTGSGQTAFNYTISAVTGQVISSGQAQHNCAIDIASLTTGVYLIQVSDASTHLSKTMRFQKL
jgi:hypothetical protein